MSANVRDYQLNRGSGTIVGTPDPHHKNRNNEKGDKMDTWGILLFVIGLILYFVTKKNQFWLFVCGVGAGIVIGAVGSYLIVMGMF
jgi:multisubunit Na+/H+ antiporter MnhG subunit